MAEAPEFEETTSEVLKAGYLYKQGGNIRNWKKRWCVLNDSKMTYYIKEEAVKEKKSIDFTKGRGVRAKKECNIDDDWPGEAKHCFGVAIEGRTWYFYGEDSADIEDWKIQIQKGIEKVHIIPIPCMVKGKLFPVHGKPNSDWKNDTVGQPVNPAIKVIQAISLQVAKMLRSHVDIDTGNEHLNAAGSVAAQVAEDQIAADPHATPQERLKMAGGTALEGVQENVDNDAVKIAAGVAKDQLEADGDLTLEQRLALAGGSTLEGVGDAVGSDAIGIAGGVVKDQATADPDTNLKQRAAMAVGSTAGGIKGATDNEVVKVVAKGVEKGAAKAVDKLADDNNDDNDD